MSVLDISCKNSDPPVEPEVLVDVKSDNVDETWVRLPVTATDLWINKDGPAAINRTAKIQFASEWTVDGTTYDVASYVNGFQQFQQSSSKDDPYDEARIWFYDRDKDAYQIAHYGYVGGVGPATDDGEMKMWVYDPSDLLRAIQVSKSWGDPTLAQVAEFVISGTNDDGQPVGLENRTIFDNVGRYVVGEQNIPVRKRDDISEVDAETLGAQNRVLVTAIGGTDAQLGDVIQDEFSILSDDEGSITIESIRERLNAQKQFRINRHNMVDHVNWFTNLVDARWWFEPSADGPVFFIDVTGYADNDKGDHEYARRTFATEEVPDGAVTNASGVYTGSGDDTLYARADALDNDALFDIKPINTITVYGESTRSIKRLADFDGSHSPIPRTESYPFVKVTYPPLVDRANGEYGPPAKETDDLTIAQARATAVNEFRQHLEEATEGEIILKGEPHILPWDHIIAVPICNDIYVDVDARPIRYEVNEVHHERHAGEHYTTNLSVSLSYDENALEIEGEMREA
jgi:hypothetical protein